VLQPGKQALNLPATFVSTQFPTVLGRRPDSIALVRDDHRDALLGQLGVQLIAVVGFVPDQFSRRIGDKPFFKSIRKKGGLPPLCRSTSYWQIHVRGRAGQDFKLPMNQCSGCSVVFTDAWRFKRLMQRTLDSRGFPEETVTRGPDDRPRPYWQGAFWNGELPPGGWTKREVDP